MKNIVLAFALMAVSPSIAQWSWEKIEGNGNVKKETRDAGAFSAVNSSGSWDVMIAYGTDQSIQLEGDENLLPYIETKVENGTLQIKSKKNVNLRHKNKITIYVTLSRLTGIGLSGSGDIIGNGKFSNDGSTKFRLSGSGNIKMSVYKLKDVEVSISGSGNIQLSGTAEMVNAKISGSGNAECTNLVTDEVSASISGSGNIKVQANKRLEASISGSGNIYYKGAASDVQKRVAGSGRVVKS